MSSTGVNVTRVRARCAAAAVAVLALMGGDRRAFAVNPTPVQLFYVPFPEDQLLQGLQAIESGGPGNTPTNPVTTYISIAAVADSTIVYYDQWENGYDADIANPLNLYSGGNPGGTQIWGDGNAANGAPPGFPLDLIDAGTVIILNNDINTGNLAAIDFDGRDKIAATKTIAVTHTAWAAGSGTLLAGSVEVFDTNSWGTNYRVPVGADIPDGTDHQMFEYTSLAIMAGEGGATVQIDKDANGVFETTQLLNEGEPFFVDGGVNVGGRVVSDNPVQVDILTGDIGSNYESRDSSLLPTTLWSTDSYTPVSTATTGGTGTTVWLYNPNAGALTVNYTTRNGGGVLTTIPLNVPGGPAGGYLPQIIPDGFGAHFAASGPFYAFSTTNSTDASSGNLSWDWGFTLVPEDSLTPQVLIGLGIGRDPTSNTNPNENGNPVWVTPLGNGNTFVTVYADFDADPATGPLTDPNGNKYDVALSLRELDRAKIYDTNDRDQTGMLVYTLTMGVKLAAAWGQDPLTASASAPGLDVGTGVPPLPLFSAGKNGTLFTDNDGDGFVSPGDVLLYTIAISNISRAPVSDILLKDNLPADTTYVPNSTFFKNASNVVSPIPDDGVGTAFPLDGAGHVLDSVTALPVGGSYEVTFKVTIDAFPNLTPGTTEILNTCSASSGGTTGTTVPCADRTPLNGCIGDFVWKDLNGDAVQDGGPETGISGVTLELYLDANGNGILDGPDTLLGTDTTTGGGYLFTGVVAGQYIVNVVNGSVPGGYVLTTANDPTALTLAGGECNLAVDFGYRPPCVTPAECDDQNPCTDDACTANSCVYTPHVGVCRSANGVCDVPENCDGNGNCPADGFAASSVVCRTQNGVCDVPENCDGNGNCPADGFAASSVVCRSQNGVCDVAENCSGGPNCPADGFAASSVVCRTQNGVCDVAENCSGGPNCPADGFAASSVVCRTQNGVCDVAENCSGGPNCPADGFASSSVVCRTQNGVCDVAEHCDGADADCPTDDFAGSNVVCRAQNGICDVAENCSGSSRNCPSDDFLPSSTVCRSANGVCDVAENCTGNDADCPADGVASTSVVCGVSNDPCDVAAHCDGVNTTCPPNQPADPGTVCDDNNPCTAPDGCLGGDCVGTPIDCRESPDDNPCTIDTCDASGGDFLCVHTNCYPDLVCPPQNPECVPADCGDTNLDPGETCDPPGAVQLNGNLCRDDCSFCGDGIVQSANSETCDDGNSVSGCDPLRPARELDDCLNSCRPPICEDPARIQLTKTPNLVKIHGRLISYTPVDFADQHFVVQLTNGGEVIYRGSLLSGSIVARSPSAWKYQDRAAKLSGGLYSLKIVGKAGYYKFTLKAYGDCSGAVSDMTTQVFVGTRQWAVRGLWRQLKSGWVLAKKDTFLEP